jgi:hypothetical protein
VLTDAERKARPLTRKGRPADQAPNALNLRKEGVSLDLLFKAIGCGGHTFARSWWANFHFEFSQRADSG